MLVGALVRRVWAEGGSAAILAKGDPGGGAILVVCAEKGIVHKVLERTLGSEGAYRWSHCGPGEAADPPAFAAYIERRRSRDPDIWVVELDTPEAERFAAETTAFG